MSEVVTGSGQINPLHAKLAELRCQQIIANLNATPVEVLLRAKQECDIMEHNLQIDIAKKAKKRK